LLHRIATAIRRTHDHLTLDASVTPNAHVWTQLMDAYQRCGYFVDAYRVWDVMYLSGQYDSVSVTVILDGCGFAGARDVALKIWTKLHNDGYSFDQANWKAWLECLCRLGNLDEAVKLLCMEMGEGQKDVAPDETCVRIVLSFASAQNQQGEVRSRVRRYLPELWKTLPEDLRLR
jgi:pentatricopeptide repeat protein